MPKAAARPAQSEPTSPGASEPLQTELF